MAAMNTTPVELFYSYSHTDEALRGELEKHLTILRRQGILSGWHFRRITAGSEWATAIDQHLNSARIVLLLISPDFLASDYCYEIEMQRALERHEAGEARVIPVILRPVLWEGAPFGKLQALPDLAKPVETWPNRDEALRNVAVGVRTAVQELTTSQPTRTTETARQRRSDDVVDDTHPSVPPEALAALPEPYVPAAGSAPTPEEAIAAFARAHFPDYELAGDCDDTSLDTDVGKLCYSLRSEWPNLRAYWLGLTFSGSLMWVFVARNEGQWSVFATATEPVGRDAAVGPTVPDAIGPRRTMPEAQALLRLHRGDVGFLPSVGAVGDSANAQWQSAFGPELTAKQWSTVVERLVALKLAQVNAGGMHLGFSLTMAGELAASALAVDSTQAEQTPRHFQDYRAAGDVKGWRFHLPARPFRTEYISDAAGQSMRVAFLDEMGVATEQHRVGTRTVAVGDSLHRTRALVHNDDEYLFSVAGPLLEKGQIVEEEQAVLREVERRLREHDWAPGATYFA